MEFQDKKERGYMEQYLYHFTSALHLPKILESGYLKLTPSNLIKPTDIKFVENEYGFKTAVSEISDPVKPVVWLTDKPEGGRLGTDGCPADKKQIRITIPNDKKYEWWVTWADKNRMNKSWRKALTNNQDYGSWYVSEEIIKLEDVLLIEDMKTKEIILDNRK